MSSYPRRTRLLAGLVAGLVLAGGGLAACSDGKGTSTPSPSPSASASASMPAPTGGTVKVTGPADKKPTIVMPKPFAVDKTVVKVINPGTGATLKSGQLAQVDYVGINGVNSNEFDSSWKRNQTSVFPLTEGGVIKGFLDGLVGQKVGSRIVIEVAPADGYTQGNAQIGVSATDTLVFVVDIRSYAPSYPKATGKVIAPKAGFPAVTVKDGIPSAVAPLAGAGPTKVESEVLVQGPGTPVAKGKFLLFNYIAATGKDGKLFDNSFSSQAISVPTLGADLGIPGLAEALVGKPAGSRVVVVVPKALAGSQATPPPGVDKNDTVVLVVDIAGVL